MEQQTTKTIGVYAGRFQPFHYGHFSAIGHILTEVDHLRIIICSIKNEGDVDDKNPFTYDERFEMITRSFDKEVLKRISIKHVRDTENDKLWTLAISNDIPNGKIITYSNNEYTVKAFNDHGFVVKPIPVKFAGLSATLIRKHIIRGEIWTHLVPSGTEIMIKKIQENNSELK